MRRACWRRRLAFANFPCRTRPIERAPSLRSTARKVRFRETQKTSTRDACATRKLARHHLTNEGLRSPRQWKKELRKAYGWVFLLQAESVMAREDCGLAIPPITPQATRLPTSDGSTTRVRPSAAGNAASHEWDTNGRSFTIHRGGERHFDFARRARFHAPAAKNVGGVSIEPPLARALENGHRCDIAACVGGKTSQSRAKGRVNVYLLGRSGLINEHGRVATGGDAGPRGVPGSRTKRCPDFGGDGTRPPCVWRRAL